MKGSKISICIEKHEQAVLTHSALPAQFDFECFNLCSSLSAAGNQSFKFEKINGLNSMLAVVSPHSTQNCQISFLVDAESEETELSLERMTQLIRKNRKALSIAQSLDTHYARTLQSQEAIVAQVSYAEKDEMLPIYKGNIVHLQIEESVEFCGRDCFRIVLSLS